MSLAAESRRGSKPTSRTQVRWYLIEAGEGVARRFFEAVDGTLLKLAQRPDIGRSRQFSTSNAARSTFVST